MRNQVAKAISPTSAYSSMTSSYMSSSRVRDQSNDKVMTNLRTRKFCIRNSHISVAVNESFSWLTQSDVVEMNVEVVWI